jgi:hypothetical protein
MEAMEECTFIKWHIVIFLLLFKVNFTVSLFLWKFLRLDMKFSVYYQFFPVNSSPDNSSPTILPKSNSSQNCVGKNCSWEELLLGRIALGKNCRGRIVWEELIREELIVNQFSLFRGFAGVATASFSKSRRPPDTLHLFQAPK